MRRPGNALLLIGSPKPGASSSAALGTYLLDGLAGQGLSTEALVLTKALSCPQATDSMLAAVAAADLVVLSFPLYIDSLPAPVIRALELIADDRAGRASRGDLPQEGDRQGLVAICQCGFPEARHDQVALEMCANFARATGFAWAGGLAMGGGGLIDARPLAERAGPLRFVVRALECGAAELAEGRPLPAEAVRLMAKPAFPAFAYRLIANRGWRHELKQRGATAPLDARPFA
jgi:hypothetical protein